MKLFIYVEGQEEEMFVNRVLRGHMNPFGVVVQKPVLAATSFRIGYDSLADITVGGVTTYDAIREDILNLFADGHIPTVSLHAFPVTRKSMVSGICKKSACRNSKRTAHDSPHGSRNVSDFSIKP